MSQQSQQPYSQQPARTPMHTSQHPAAPSSFDVFFCLHCRQWLAAIDSGGLRFGNAIIRSRIELVCSCCGRKRVWRPVKPSTSTPKKAS